MVCSGEKKLLFAGPQEINQTPSLLRCKLILEAGHAAEAEGDCLEDMGVAPAPYEITIETGRGRNEFFADRAAFC